MKIETYFFSLVFIVLFSGCVTTDVISFKDPDYTTTIFHNYLVIVNSNDFEKRLLFEKAISNELMNEGIKATAGYILLPPTKEFTEEQKVQILKDNKIDCYISVIVGEQGVTEIYIPPTGSTTTTKGNIGVLGNTASYEQKSKTTYQGGYTIAKPWADFIVKIYDVSNGQNAWIAKYSSVGSVLTSFPKLYDSFSKKLANSLLKENIAKKYSYLLTTSSDPNCFFTAGRDYYEKSDYQTAAIFLRKAVELVSTNDQKTFFSMGRDYFDKADYYISDICFTKAIELDSTNAESYYFRALCKYYLKNKSDACEDMTRAEALGIKRATSAKKKMCE